MDFSKLILLRQKKDLTQRDLAKILGVSKSTYARWETQEEIIPLYHLTNQRDFAKLLNTSQSTICAYENGKTLVLTAFIYSLAHEFNDSVDRLCGLEKTLEEVK